MPQYDTNQYVNAPEVVEFIQTLWKLSSQKEKMHFQLIRYKQNQNNSGLKYHCHPKRTQNEPPMTEHASQRRRFGL